MGGFLRLVFVESWVGFLRPTCTALVFSQPTLRVPAPPPRAGQGGVVKYYKVRCGCGCAGVGYRLRA